MKKSFLAAALVCAMLSACASSDKTGDATASADRMNAWSDADITNLSDTRYAEQFKNTVNPIIYFWMVKITFQRPFPAPGLSAAYCQGPLCGISIVGGLHVGHRTLSAIPV